MKSLTRVVFYKFTETFALLALVVPFLVLMVSLECLGSFRDEMAEYLGTLEGILGLCYEV